MYTWICIYMCILYVYTPVKVLVVFTSMRHLPWGPESIHTQQYKVLWYIWSLGEKRQYQQCFCHSSPEYHTWLSAPLWLLGSSPAIARSGSMFVWQSVGQVARAFEALRLRVSLCLSLYFYPIGSYHTLFVVTSVGA